MGYFYPEKTKLLEVMHTLASELGGKLTEPRYNPRITALRMLCGRKVADGVTDTYRKLKLATAVKWDETLYRISKPSSVETHD